MRRIALVLLLATACASVPPADVRESMSGFMSALNNLDAEGINAYFAEDATAFFPVVKAERLDGKGAIAAIFHQYVAGSTKKTNIVPEDLRVDRRGDVAIVTFNVHNPSAVSRRTFVWRLDGGVWRIVHMHASNTPVKSAT
jgi:ketosteroid isomerase-like protein